MIKIRTQLACLHVSLILSGCALTTSPRLASIDRTSGINDLDGASNYVLKIKRELEIKLTDQDQLSHSARLGIIGGTLAATAAAIYKAHRDTVVGFGLVGASSYAVGNLYSPAVYAEIYEAGLAAAQCVDSFAAPAAAMMPLIERNHTLLNDAVADLEASGASHPSRAEEVNEVIAAGMQTVQRAADYLAREPLLARKVVLAADEIVQIANKQIRVNTPNLDAFASVGRSVFASAVNIPGATQPVPDKKLAGLRRPLPLADLGHAIKVVKDADRNLKAQLDAFDKLGDPQTSVCLDQAKITAAKPFDVGSTDVALSGDQTYTFNVSGGRPPYTAGWIGTNPPADVLEASQVPFSSTAYRVTSKKPFNRTYTYRIEDNERTGRDITIRFGKGDDMKPGTSASTTAPSARNRTRPPAKPK